MLRIWQRSLLAVAALLVGGPAAASACVDDAPGPPALSAVSLSPSRVPVDAAQHPVGTTLRFTLSQSGRVSIVALAWGFRPVAWGRAPGVDTPIASPPHDFECGPRAVPLLAVNPGGAELVDAAVLGVRARLAPNTLFLLVVTPEQGDSSSRGDSYARGTPRFVWFWTKRAPASA